MANLLRIGGDTIVSFPNLKLKGVPARIDTGAKTSAIWASGVKESDGWLSFTLFGKQSSFYTGQKMSVKDYQTKLIRSTSGLVERRYVVRLVVVLGGRKIKGSFTLANRSRQTYPVLIGRNLLRGKFIVDIRHGLKNIRSLQERIS